MACGGVRLRAITLVVVWQAAEEDEETVMAYSIFLIAFFSPNTLGMARGRKRECRMTFY